jgi:hypothetical protein
LDNRRQHRGSGAARRLTSAPKRGRPRQPHGWRGRPHVRVSSPPGSGLARYATQLSRHRSAEKSRRDLVDVFLHSRPWERRGAFRGYLPTRRGGVRLGAAILARCVRLPWFGEHRAALVSRSCAQMCNAVRTVVNVLPGSARSAQVGGVVSCRWPAGRGRTPAPRRRDAAPWLRQRARCPALPVSSGRRADCGRFRARIESTMH